MIYAIVGLAAIFGVIGEAITEYLEFIQEKALHESRSSECYSCFVAQCVYFHRYRICI